MTRVRKELDEIWLSKENKRKTSRKCSCKGGKAIVTNPNNAYAFPNMELSLDTV